MWKIDLVKDRDKKSCSIASPTADSPGMCVVVVVVYLHYCLTSRLL